MYKIYVGCLLSIFNAYAAFGQTAPKTCDILIRNTTIADVVNKKLDVRQNILITGDKIVAIGDTTLTPKAKRVIDGRHLLTLPGFVNTHTHLWQHISKSTYPKEKLQEWVRVYNPIHYLEEKELHDVVVAASSEALLSGITTVSDYASLAFNDYSLATNLKALTDAGLDGVMIWHNPSIFIPDSIKPTEIARLQNTFKDHFSIWMGQGPLSFHSLPQVYSGIKIGKEMGLHFSEHTMENMQEQRDLLTRLTAYFEKFGDRLSATDREFFGRQLKTVKPSGSDLYEVWRRMTEEILEADKTAKKLSPDEVTLLTAVKNERIISPLPILDYFQVLDGFLSIHSVWLQPEDIELLHQHGGSISHNPQSNLYLSSGVAPIRKYRDADVPVTIGTDGAASNDGIDFFSAMREMWNVYKLGLLNTDRSKDMDGWAILQAATINGAKALLLDDRTGSVAVGKEADLCLVTTDELGMAPVRADKIINLLIYSGNAQNVEYVLSNGKMVVDKGKLVRFKEEDLAKRLTAIAQKVDLLVEKGKKWNDVYNLLPNSSPYWYRYRSVRKADEISLTLTNRSAQTLRLHVVCSGSRFSGGSPYVVDADVAKRFPEDPPAASFHEQLVLAPGASAFVRKASGQDDYVLASGSSTINKTGSAGQLLLYVDGHER